MDYIKNVDSCKYVMSLDTLDLALLPKYSSRLSKTKASLWNANNWNFNSTDYFEFEIKPKTEATIIDEDSKSDNGSTNYQSDLNHLSGVSTPTLPNVDITTCHICDLDVPSAYIDDHENSLKHKAYLKIANVVLERTRKHMVKKSSRYVQKSNSTFFCGPCTTVVLVADRGNHEKSKAHKRSVSLDRVLYELVDLYTHEEHDESSSVKSVDDNKTKVDETVDNKVVISDIRARLDELETKTIESYIKMIDEFNEDKVYVLSAIGDDLKISTDDYDIIVAEDNFNGFIRVDAEFILCIVCKMVLNEEKAHKISDAHIKNIASPFKDHHCIRTLEHLNHCVICNKIVGNADLHVLCDNTHSELLKKALICKKNKEKYIDDESRQKSNVSVNKNQPIVDKEVNVSIEKPSELNVAENKKTEINKFDDVKIKTNIPNGVGNDTNPNNANTNGNRLLKSITVAETKADPFIATTNDMCICAACNIEIHVNNIESHAKGSKHAFNSKSELHYIMKDVGSVNLLCRVCSIYTADDVNEIRAHITTEDHISKYKTMLYNNIIIKQESGFICIPCDTVVLKMNEFYHMEKMKHEINLTAYTEKMNKQKTVKHASNLKPDKVPAPSNLKPSDKPAPSNLKPSDKPAPSNLKPSDKPAPSNLNPIDKKPAHFCYVCQVYIPNNPYNISTHNDGMRHKKNAVKIEVVETETNSSIENSTIHYHMKATENEKTLTCKICKVAIPNIDDSITEHVVGKKHDLTLKAIMIANNMIYVEGGYFCNSCKYSIKHHNLFEHINDAYHKVLIALKQEPEVEDKESEGTEIQSQANTSIDPSDTTENDIDTDLKDKYVEFKHHFVETDKEWLECKICDAKIPNTEEDVANHVKKQKHVDGYKNLMADSLILEMDKGLICVVCFCMVPVKGEVHHAKGTRHMRNMISAISKTHCDICNQRPADMLKHILSKEHVIKAMKNHTLVHYCEYCETLIPKGDAEEHPNSCHKFAVKDKICFCTVCDPYLPGTSKGKFN